MFVAIPAGGHLTPLLRQARELARRGWRTAVASADEARGLVAAQYPEVPFVSLGTYPGAAERTARVQAQVSAQPDPTKGALAMMRWAHSLWPLMYDGLRAATAADCPDVLVVDLISVAGMDAAEVGGIPYLVNNADLLPVISVRLLPPAPGVPLLFSGRSIHEGRRWRRALDPLIARAGVAFVELTLGRELSALRRARGLPPQAITRRPAGVPIMTDSAFGLEYPRPLPPRMHMVGPMLEEPPPVPGELRDWLEASPPVVYANLGTVVRPEPDVLARIAAGLTAPEFRALWVVRPRCAPPSRRHYPPGYGSRTGCPPSRPSWPTRRCALSSATAGSTASTSSLAGGTPLVGIPFLADQRDMAARVVDAGVGLHLDKGRFSAASLRAGIRRVLQEPSFRERIPPIQESFVRAGGYGGPPT